MRIVCIGGGPGGLYFSILLKKKVPDADITLIERNAPGDTFGWGVVFSDETLAYLEENDGPTHEAIFASFQRWNAIDVHYREEVLRSTGHGFAGISRKRLLSILQDRAKELGVKLEFSKEVDSLAPYADADLIVLADGVNSKFRKRYESVFKPSLDVRKSKYIWLGTKKKLDAFTFAFRENEHGVFQAHAYRFEDDTSTFIVETDEASFRAARLNETSLEETLTYLEKLFAKELGGEKLLPNRSSWLNFVTLRNETWSFAPGEFDGTKTKAHLVLIGDAAHTAHFSIGSGTKLAMEDAIALANACAAQKDIAKALVAYDDERHTIVLRTQKAAEDSLRWFENVRRYVGYDLLPFAFNLLSRSKRIGYDNLKLRDPAFVANVTNYFADHASELTEKRGAHGEAPPPMFTPFRLRNMRLKNRVVVSPMCMYSAEKGLINDFHLVHLGSRAMGGAALVVTEMTCVAEDARITLGCAGLYTDAHEAAWKRVVDYVHHYSTAKICLQLGHAGRKGATKLMLEGMDEPLESDAWPIVSASPLPYLATSQIPKELDRAGMDRVQSEFVAATERAARIGFDMVEVHLAHGYLLASFISPLTNFRKDEYGGNVENRLRFPLEIVRAVRATWPEDKPLSVRISATDWLQGGIDDDDLLFIGNALKAAGVDILDVSAGQTVKEQQPIFGRMYQTPWSDLLRNEVDIPTMTVGNISSADQINTILAARRADLCVLARPHLKNPNWTFAAAEEQGFTEFDWPDMYSAVKPIPKRL